LEFETKLELVSERAGEGLMGLRIKTNVASLAAQRSLSKTTDAQQVSMEKLASGHRINRSADDAAGLAISESMKAKIRSLEQAKRNANDGISLIQVAEGGFNEVSSILVRLRELAIQSASDTIGNEERSYTNREYVQLVDEIDRIAKTTEFNGLKLLQGNEGVGMDEISLHIDAGDASVPNVDNILLNAEDFKINSDEILGLGKESEIGPMASGDDFARETAASRIETIDRALTLVASNRATLGAKQNRLTSTVSNLSVKIENLATSNSRVRDLDFAAETAIFTQQRILGQAGTSVLSQANQTPELVLSLLR
jgi:flagellin